MDKYTVFRDALSINKSDKLCEKGFLMTNGNVNNTLPEYIKEWNHTDLSGFSFYIHPKQFLYYMESDNDIYFLIGHAYNPYTNCIDEQEILSEWINAEKKGKEEALDYVNSITGLYLMGKISHNIISVMLDCAGMMGGYYGVLGNNVIITSHTVLAAELFNLEPTEYVNELLNYKFYSLYGSFLPGDITPYNDVYRIVPNTIVVIDCENFKTKVKRFYPNAELKKVTTEEEYEKQIERIASVFQNTMELISIKWKKPAISLTGGMDSKTTLAAANGNYDKFYYFSYITSKAEQLDAEAANKICGEIGINHKIYEISPQPQDYSNFENTKNILQYNKDYIGKSNTNDICKRIFFEDTEDFDVEVKSWVSEIARANYYKKFGKKKMPKKISPRRCSSMYKIFLHNRSLLHKTDKVFEEYINKTDLKNNIFNFDWSDLFLWEIRYGAWGGLVITSEHKYSFDITIPYNNRKLLELMLAVPLQKRRKDILHNDLIKYMNQKIFDTGITIVNLNETKFREFCEKCYFNINTFLPF